MARDRSLDEFLDAGSSDDVDESDVDDGGPDAGDHETLADATNGSADANDGRDHADLNADDDRGGERADTDDTTVDDADDPDAATDKGDVVPAQATYDWSPQGDLECGSCGARVVRRWRGESGMVCPECKTW